MIKYINFAQRIKNTLNTKKFLKISCKERLSNGKIGVVKIHKQNYPTRLVLSVVNTPKNSLAKWLEK